MLGVEMTMLARAVRDGKRVDGLEAVEEQLAFLDGLSLDAQRDLLLQSLEESARIRESIDEMIRAWHHGDIATLESSLLESFAGHDELNDALVTQRTQRWVSQIGELLDDNDDYLIVVGALHLVGELGVPRLLEKKGVTIEQLSDPAPVR